ncbi:hypothetical protein [Paenibacillus alvei]|uniref:Uncharacterized protein n=1 Tax=Paenibacillus alvei TaxID=44250 RepID=A0A383RBU2_PAEAL|nr:hypothetical protein [Paenibacillus alvei]SYX83994.1 protein of unknown function [Paenibacillus alvei]
MVYYSDSVAAKDLIPTIWSLITKPLEKAKNESCENGKTGACWEQVCEAEGVFYSNGSSGKENIFLIIKEHIAGYKFKVNFAIGSSSHENAGCKYSYQPLEGSETEVVYFKSEQDKNVKVSYDINITEDRIILHVQGDKQIGDSQNPVVYLGMPIRYEKDDKLCIVKAQSENELPIYKSKLNVLQDPTRVQSGQKSEYEWYHIKTPRNPSWGNSYFIETLYFGKENEGLRGELEGLYGLVADNVNNGDVLKVSNSLYKAIVVQPYKDNAFPREILLMKIEKPKEEYTSEIG